MESENGVNDNMATCTSCNEKVVSPMYLTSIGNQMLCNICKKRMYDQFPEKIEEPIPLDEPGTGKSVGSSSESTPSGGGALGCGLGCLGGWLYLMFILISVSNLFKNSPTKTIMVDILALLGPLPVLYYAKKNNKRALFWGFIIPYLLLLLLFGQCTGYGRRL